MAPAKAWEHFVPPFTKVGKTENCLLGIPYGDGRLLGCNEIWMVPAHFLHSTL